MQRIREFQAAHIYSTVQEHVVKNAIVMFSVELLLRLLPEHAPLLTLFDFATGYFITLDKKEVNAVANFPLYFIIECSRLLGYEPHGDYSEQTPHLNLHEGGFTKEAPALNPFVSDEDARMLGLLLQVQDYDGLKAVEINAAIRLRLIDWYIAFLQSHTQHMGNMRSISVLRMILH